MDTDRIVGLTLILLIVAGYSVLLFNDVIRIRAQKKYEDAFMLRHRNFINRHHFSSTAQTDFIRLTFPPREVGNLLDLCKQPWSKWTARYYATEYILKTYEPSIQIHYLNFRKTTLERNPVRVELVRCSERFALIEAGDDISGYVLEKCDTAESVRLRYTLFCIYTKFIYNQESRLPLEKIEIISNQVPQES